MIFFFLFSKTTISWLITGFVTKLIRRVPLVGKELFTLPEHLSSPPIFSGVCVTQSLVLCVCFVDQCLSFCTFSFGHCVVCSSLIYVFLLHFWYHQNLLSLDKHYNNEYWHLLFGFHFFVGGGSFESLINHMSSKSGNIIIGKMPFLKN